MPAIHGSFRELSELLLVRAPGAAFRPGRTREAVVEAVTDHGARALDDVIEWFALQDGLTGTHVRLPFDYSPDPLDRTLAEWVGFLEMIAAIEADEDDPDEVRQLRGLDFWPKPGWFPLSMAGDGKFIVETRHPARPGQVVRCWADQLEVYAESVADFVELVNSELRSGF